MAPERLVSPTLDQILAFCAREPVERVFLEDIARRGLGRFSALERDGALVALCHVGANVVPSGESCAAFADATARSRARMIIGEEQAVDALWGDASARMPEPRDDRPGQPVYVLGRPARAGGDGDPRRDARRPRATRAGMRGSAPRGDRDRPAPQGPGRVPLADALPDRGAPFVDLGGERRHLLQGRGVRVDSVGRAAQQVWVDPSVRNRGYAKWAMRDLCRLLLARVPTVRLFVRPENDAAIRVYDGVGMERTIMYRSLIF